jgi:recombination protein RecA
MFGNPETTSGGNALKFYSSMRLDIRAIGKLKKGEDVIGNRVRVKVIKNKLAPPFKQVETDLLFGQGINKEGEIVDLAVDKNIIEKAGAWYSYKDDKIGQGREAACEWLKVHSDVSEKILTELRVEHGQAI